MNINGQHIEFSKGDSYSEDSGLITSAINIHKTGLTHYNAIEVHCVTINEAEEIRDKVLAALEKVKS